MKRVKNSKIADEVDNKKLMNFMYEIAKKAQSEGVVGRYEGWGLISEGQEHEKIAGNVAGVQDMCNKDGRITLLRWSSLSLDTGDSKDFAVKLGYRLSP